MTIPKPRLTPFAERVPTAAVSAKPAVTANNRPEFPKNRVVILKKQEDGTVLERSGAPLFVYKDPKFLGTRFILPADR